ncbi:MAG: efflux transporter outer membrane subunit [Gammaproteobacteria bacterium]|nr:efflux transporter outer membrane subunit [Gammaproteobacteria bacterium]MBU1465339.1 efflux transporter outer membrane subunit [Gammaproteobacteria bacterium]MBU2024849.1 efflux transporter outer membrane subunit [Gammaproteobacteria bacterium]MBU2239797.1 efflux transporter outer membrane subunit [Gammaproteobacteria bacterium]MBU2319161.1 efflux transporter outer membrane subunit [Gammaproteobacteria bacterium]
MLKLVKITPFMLLYFLYGCAPPSSIKTHNTMDDESLISHASNLDTKNLYSSNWPSQSWWLSLEDSQLNQLIAKALKNSPDIQMANANLEKASAFVMSADSKFDPVVSADAGVTRSRLSRVEDYSYQGNKYGTVYNLGLNMNYSFDLWGGNKAAWIASVNDQKAAEIDHQAAKINLSSAIIRIYIQLANAYSLEDLAKEDLERTQRIVSITRQLLSNGLTSDDHLYTAQGNEASAKQVLKNRTLSIQLLKNALATLVGAGPDLANTINRPDAHMGTKLNLPEQLPANLIAHRPDIVAAKWRVEAANKNIEVAKTRFYPNVNLSASAGFKKIAGDSMFGEESRSWSVGPAISLPLFTQGLKANLIDQTASYDAAVAQYNKTIVKAFGDVTDSVLSIKSINEQIQDAEQSLQLVTKSYHITEKRYQSGMGSQLEVLLIENQLLQAESVTTQLKNQLQEQQVALIEALGGGFEDSQSTSVSKQ